MNSQEDDAKDGAEKNKEGQFTAYFGKAGKKALERYSKRTRVSMNKVVNTAVKGYIGAKPRSKNENRLMNLGMVDVIHPANGHDHSKEIAGATEVNLVFNDMRHWLPGPRGTGLHLEALRARLKAGKRTRIFLLHPRTKFIEPVSKVSDKERAEQIGEIETAVHRICAGLWEQALANDIQLYEKKPLLIIGHPFYNTYSMIMADERAWVNYYPIAFRREGDVGHFHVYSKTDPNGLYARLETDIGVIQREAENHFKARFDLVRYFHRRQVSAFAKIKLKSIAKR
jgi:hypothetical protein